MKNGLFSVMKDPLFTLQLKERVFWVGSLQPTSLHDEVGGRAFACSYFMGLIVSS